MTATVRIRKDGTDQGRAVAPSQSFVVHYAEVALKGKNRPEFVRCLSRNIRRSLSRSGPVSVESRDGRLIVTASGAQHVVEEALSKTFGVAWFAPIRMVDDEYESIKEALLELVAEGSKGAFRISARRSDKSFSLTSGELETRLGGEVVRLTGRSVDLSNPDESLHVDVLPGRALVYSDRMKGPGGLPVGTGGRTIHLFSGGIDSPVAAWLLMKRGCVPVHLHFYLAPTPLYALESKVVGLLKVLAPYSGRSTMLLVPFDNYQLAASDVPEELEPTLFRRFMRITAEVLADRFGASAISTGDCLSQAASQTLWNMKAIDGGSSLPVLRPLLAYDKDEVIQLARKIGTYELSIAEYKDCCAIVTRHPKTRVREAVISAMASELNFRRLAESSIGHGTLVTYDPHSGKLKTSQVSASPSVGLAQPADAAVSAAGSEL